MSECLVTKLKSSVNDDYLRKMGELRFDINSTSSHSIQLNVASSNAVLRIVGDGTYTPDGGSPTKECKLITDWNNGTLSAGKYTVFISDKYNLRFNSSWSGSYSDRWGVSMDMKELQYSSFIVQCSFAFTSVYGSISDIPSAPSVTTVNFSNTKVEGDVSVIGGKFYNATEILFSEVPTVYGTLESMLNLMVSKGRNSGTCKVYMRDSGVTYQGEPVTDGYKTVTFTQGSYSVS